MRPISRIDIFMDAFAKIWKEKVPDWRFGQLLSNFLGWVYTEKHKKDIFFIEEQEMLELLNEYFETKY